MCSSDLSESGFMDHMIQYFASQQRGQVRAGFTQADTLELYGADVEGFAHQIIESDV